MDKMSFKSGKLLAAATAAVGLAGYTSSADGSLIIDVRASGATGGTVDNAKHVSVAGPGSVVNLNVYARVTGTDGINNETLQQATGSGSSSAGGLLGNLAHLTSAPFNAASSNNGALNDFDSDGDLDVGSLGSTSAGKIIYRAAAPTPVPGVDANTGEVLIGTMTFTVTGGDGGTVVNFIPRQGSISGTIWQEDGVATNKTPGTSTFAAGSPGVTIEIIPEPASLGVLGIAGLGLLARRRNRA